MKSWAMTCYLSNMSNGYQFSGISDICQDTKFDYVCSPKILIVFQESYISFNYALLYFVIIHDTFRDNTVYSKLFISFCAL